MRHKRLSALIDTSMCAAARNCGDDWRVEADYKAGGDITSVILTRGSEAVIYDLRITTKFVRVLDLDGAEMGRAALREGGRDILQLLCDLAAEHFLSATKTRTVNRQGVDYHHVQ